MSAYSNKFVCSVKVNNKILREKFQDNQSSVFIPFGSEYSLLLKNLGGRNAVVHIEIDGRKVSENGFYMRAGHTADIERFVENLTEGRRFKFIEKTEEISDFRGDKIDDGIIRITWQFEKPLPEVQEIRYNYKHDHYHNHHNAWCRCPWCHLNSIGQPYTYINTSIPVGNITYTASNSRVGGTQSSCFNSSVAGQQSPIGSVNFLKSSEPVDGITVEGSKSFQQFRTAYAGALESNMHSMIIILKGTRDKAYVNKPIIVREKFKCPTCGRKWHSNYEFCANCGTALRK
jgi:hypothetical protein